MQSPSRFARQIVARFVPVLGRTVRCSSCERSTAAVTHMVAGPNVYLCDGCVEQAARQLTPRQPALDGVQCHFCRHVRGKPDVTTVGSVNVCADCLGAMTTMLADAAPPSRPTI